MINTSTSSCWTLVEGTRRVSCSALRVARRPCLGDTWRTVVACLKQQSPVIKRAVFRETFTRNYRPIAEPETKTLCNYFRLNLWQPSLSWEPRRESASDSSGSSSLSDITMDYEISQDFQELLDIMFELIRRNWDWGILVIDKIRYWELENPEDLDYFDSLTIKVSPRSIFFNV